jgi:hypothetical protein
MSLLRGADPRPPALFDRIRRGLGQTLGGFDDPRLSEEQNAAAGKQGRMNAGLAMMMASGAGQHTRPNLSQIVAQGAMVGQQAGAAGREQQYMQTQEQRIAQALQDPQIMSKLSPQQQAMIRMLPPMQAAEALQKILSAEPKVVGEGGDLVGPTGDVIHSNERQHDPSSQLPQSLVAFLQAAGIDPRQFMQQPEDVRRSILDQWKDHEKSKATNISVSNSPEGRTSNAMVDIATDDYRYHLERANGAMATLGTLAEMERVLDRGLRTGAVTELTRPARAVARQLGINIGNIPDEQVFLALANDATLAQTMKLKGAISNKEMDFLSRTMPSLGTTPEGNRMLITVLRRLAEREIAITQMANQHMQESGGVMDQRWMQKKFDWVAQQNMFLDLADNGAARVSGQGAPGMGGRVVR